MDEIEAEVTISEKSRFTAAVLQLFCGCFGLGRFYLGYKTYGVLQIVTTLMTCGAGGLAWGFVDGIMILNGTVFCDGNGNLLI